MAKRSNKILTRDLLEYLGITQIDEDGTVHTKQGVLKPRSNSKYGHSRVVFRDKTIRNEAKLSGTLTTNTGYLELSIHRIVYAWFNKVLPAELEVHHIDLDPTNNSIKNLVALTHEQHVEEHRKARQSLIKEEKCRLDIPREYYVKKIKEFEAKKDYSSVSHYRARLKYYDNHIKEAIKMTEFQKDKIELAYWKKCFRTSGNKAMHKECVKVEKVAKASTKEDAQMIIKHALEVIHKHFGRD